MTNLLFTNSDRIAAVRMALGAALAHEETAKLSNRALARKIGCGETTVRRYRKIAADIGLAGAIRKGGAPLVLHVPDTLPGELRAELNELKDITAYPATAFCERLHDKACALLDLLDQNPSEEELLRIKSAAERLFHYAEELEEEDFLA